MKIPLDFQPIAQHADLVSPSVYRAVSGVDGILVAEIDPQYMNGMALAEHYDVAPDDGANCIIVRGKRDGVRKTAAILIPVGYRADLKGVISERLGVKNISMAPLEEVLQETGMEYGSITPVGLPDAWPIFIDSRLMDKETIIVGGGKQISKLQVPTTFLKHLSAVEIIVGLGAIVAPTS